MNWNVVESCLVSWARIGLEDNTEHGKATVAVKMEASRKMVSLRTVGTSVVVVYHNLVRKNRASSLLVAVAMVVEASVDGADGDGNNNREHRDEEEVALWSTKVSHWRKVLAPV